MSHLRLSTIRAGYRRVGLTFAKPDARPMADGRLAIVLAAEKLSAEQLAELRADPNVTIDRVGPDGLTAVERHQSYRGRLARRRRPEPNIPAGSQVADGDDKGEASGDPTTPSVASPSERPRQAAPTHSGRKAVKPKAKRK